MGYLSAKDLGAVSLKTTSSLIVADTDSVDGINNPEDNYGVIDLRSFSISFDTGKNVDDSANVSGMITRLAMGSKNPIPLTLQSRVSRKKVTGDYSQLTMNYITTLDYLVKWSRSRTIVMLFWMPNDNDSTLLSYGQEPDFFTSQLRTIYDTIWDWNTDSSTSGWQGTDPTTGTYGTNHFRIEMSGSIGNYDVCAVPVIFNNVTIKESADKTWVDISVTGYFLEEEQRV